jgi:hypothetical protein
VHSARALVRSIVAIVVVERVKGWIIAEQELAELKRMISPGEMRVTYEQQLCTVTKEWSFEDDDN